MDNKLIVLLAIEVCGWLNIKFHTQTHWFTDSENGESLSGTTCPGSDPRLINPFATELFILCEKEVPVY
jgi:hypothetical protein